ncbi:MAG: zinc ribbon domain-containing protein [Burkholderiaceae bacterium]|jgi:hypothetical protein|nr:zinc ribbon domain-containing protein [Burkholderiaceae bacterium]
MQRCPDCGHLNRPGVRFCTHCGKPEPASGATAKGPTAVVAVAVLAVGLLAFLSIGPIAPRQAGSAAIEAPAQVVEPSDAATVPVPAPTAVTAEAIAAVDAVTDVEAVTASAELARPPAAESAPPALATGTPALVEPPPALDSAMSGPDPVSDVIESADLVLPAAVPLAMPSPPAPAAPAQHLASSALHKDAASRTSVSPAHASATPESPAHASASPSPLPALSSPARHAAIDAAPARLAASPSSRQPASWLNRLRAELAACEGDFFARTLCRETAKHRHCASANAWGMVPECPAARLPDLANFN